MKGRLVVVVVVVVRCRGIVLKRFFASPVVNMNMTVVRSTLLYLFLSAGLRLVLGLPALLHDFYPLTLNF